MLDFLAYLEFERGLSRNTLDAYRTDLFQFGRFLGGARAVGARREPRNVADFPRTARHRRRQRGGRTRRLPPATIHRKSACLRSFYRHLRRDGLLDRTHGDAQRPGAGASCRRY